MDVKEALIALAEAGDALQKQGRAGRILSPAEESAFENLIAMNINLFMAFITNKKAANGKQKSLQLDSTPKAEN